MLIFLLDIFIDGNKNDVILGFTFSKYFIKLQCYKILPCIFIILVYFSCAS